MARIESLTRKGRMEEAGMRAVAAARRSGAWAAARARERVDELPVDLAAALKAHAGTLEAYRALTFTVK